MKLHIKTWNSSVGELQYREVESDELQSAFSFLALWELLEREIAGSAETPYLSYTREMEALESAAAMKLTQDRTKDACCHSLEEDVQAERRCNEPLRRANLHGNILNAVMALQNKGTKSKRTDVMKGGTIDRQRLKQFLGNSLPSGFLDQNWGKIQELLDERGNVFQTDAEYTLFRLILFLHGQANCGIMGDPLDCGEYRQWGDPRFNGKDSVALMHTLLDQARYPLEDGQLRTAAVLEIAPRRVDVLELPLYKGQERLEEALELVRIEKKRPVSPGDQGETTRVTLGGTGISRTLAPGKTLFALRSQERYIGFLPNVSQSGGFKLVRSEHDPYTLVLSRPNGGHTEMTFEARPACWAYSPGSDLFVCIDDNGCVSSKPAGVCGVRKGVMVSMWDRSSYVLRPDGRVWSNMLGPEKLENIIFLSAGPNCAVFVDAARRVHVLRGGKLECAAVGAGPVVSIEWSGGNYRFIYLNRETGGKYYGG